MNTPGAENQDQSQAAKICSRCGKPVFTVDSGGTAPHLAMDEECCCEPEGISLGDGLMGEQGAEITRTRQIPMEAQTAQKEGEGEGLSKLPQDMSGKLRKLRRTNDGLTFDRPEANASKSDQILLKDGATIGGAYRIVKRIGSGAMGDVYLAEHIMLGMKCALKVIPPDHVTQLSWERFQTEAKAIAMLDHPNLVKVSDLGVHEGCLPFYAMQYFEGSTLEDVLAGQRKLPLKTVLEIFIPLCDALEYAHRHSVVHRDLKPANIMLLAGPIDKDSIKLLDFGLAKLTQQDKHKKSLTSVGEIFGSPPYMSPEQCRGDEIDSRSDIYSLGCTLFECLTGRPPFDGTLATTLLYNHQRSAPPTLASIVGPNKFPDTMEMVMERLLRKDPLDRYQTMVEVRRDLELISCGENISDEHTPQSLSGIMRMRSSQTKMPAVRGSGMNNQGEGAPGAYGAAGGQTAEAGGGGGAESTNGQARSAAHSSGRHQAITSGKRQAITTSTDESSGAGAAASVYDDPDVWVIRKPPKAVLVLMAILLLGLSGAYWYYNQHKEARLPVAPVVSTDSLPPSEKEAQSFATITTEGGKHIRRFTFPVDVSIGQIHSAANLVLVPAMGQVQFEESDQVYYVPDDVVVKFPGYLKRFGVGDVYAVTIPNVPSCNQLLQTCSAIAGLHKLTIYRCQNFTSADLKCLSNYNSLDELDCSYNKIDVSAMAELPGLKALKTLKLSGELNIDPVIKSLANSSTLQELYLDDCLIDFDTLATIASLPNLTTLSLNSDNLTDGDLTTLSKCPKLHFLSILNTPITQQTAGILKSFPDLKSVHIYGKPIDQTDQEDQTSPIMQLRNALPTIQVR
jgi:serine/threonine protein kinase